MVRSVKRLNPNNPYIHQRPKQKGFNIDKHDPNMEIIYFDKAKVGINTVSKYGEKFNLLAHEYKSFKSVFLSFC